MIILLKTFEQVIYKGFLFAKDKAIVYVGDQDKAVFVEEARVELALGKVSVNESFFKVLDSCFAALAQAIETFV